MLPSVKDEQTGQYDLTISKGLASEGDVIEAYQGNSEQLQDKGRFSSTEGLYIR